MHGIIMKIEVIIAIHFSYGIVSVIKKLSIHYELQKQVYELEVEILFKKKDVMCCNMHN
jgi:hypothetical protein